MVIREDIIDEDCYIVVSDCGNNMYNVNTSSYECKGFYKQISEYKSEIRLDSWYDKKTKRYKGPKNKLFKHTSMWFASIVGQALKSTHYTNS